MHLIVFVVFGLSLFFHLNQCLLALPVPGKSVLKVSNLELCDESIDGLQIIKWEFVPIDDTGAKALNAHLVTTFDMTDQFTYTMDVSSWAHNRWAEGMYNLEGNLCDDSLKYVRTALEKFADQIQPNVGHLCNMPAGEYTVNNFQVDSSEFDFPSALYGRYRSSFKVFGPNGELAFCLITEEEQYSE